MVQGVPPETVWDIGVGFAHLHVEVELVIFGTGGCWLFNDSWKFWLHLQMCSQCQT